MGVTECSFPKCEMHDFVMKTVDHMKDMQEVSINANHAQETLVVKLTENLLELQRNNERLQKLFESLQEENKARDKRIEDNSKFIHKAVGVLGGLTFIALLAPLAIWIIKVVAQADVPIRMQ